MNFAIASSRAHAKPTGGILVSKDLETQGPKRWLCDGNQRSRHSHNQPMLTMGPEESLAAGFAQTQVKFF